MNGNDAEPICVLLLDSHSGNSNWFLVSQTVVQAGTPAYCLYRFRRGVKILQRLSDSKLQCCQLILTCSEKLAQYACWQIEIVFHMFVLSGFTAGSIGRLAFTPAWEVQSE